MNNQRQTKQRFRCKMISWITLIFYIFQPIVGVLANPQTNIAPNGVEIVDINAPNQSGVSHNQYDRFNVKEKGLIFNNSGEIINTTLAGYILGNPNIKANSASLILNEVIGTQPSYLNGYMEIAGNKAQLIIANPNGIIGNGFGFINTSRAVLTTGTPIFGDQGTLAGFNVNDGTIAIEGQGLNANEIDRVDILAKAVEVNAGIWANQLNVVTGKNTVDNDLNLQTSDLDEPIGVALDVSALGGMYANKIRLIGTQNGVGVNSKGAIIATDSLTLNQQGKILFAGTTLADQTIDIKTKDQLENQGQLHANGNLDIQAVSVNNGNLMTANQDVNLTASLVNSKGFLGAGIDEDGIFNENGNLHIDADTISLKNAKTCAGNDIALQATQTVENQGQIYANGKLAIQAPSIHNENLMAANQDTNLTASLVTSTGFLGAGISEEGIFNQNGNLQVTADNISLSNAKTRAGNDIILQATQAIENENSKILANGTILLTAKDRVDNTQNGQIVGNQSVEIQAGAVNSTGLIGVGIDEAGTLSKDGTLSIAADTISFQHAKTYAGKKIRLQASESIENEASILLSNGNALLTANGIVSNKNGQMISNDSIEIQASAVNSTGLIGVGIDEAGILSKDGTLSIAADTISFQHAKTYAGETIELQAKESIENTESTILSNGDALLTANGMVSNKNGQLLSQKSIQIQAGVVDSSGLIGVGIDEEGRLSEDGTLEITADNILFDHARTYAGADIKLEATQNIENESSTLLINKSLALHADGMVRNKNGKLMSKESIEVQTGAMDSSGLIGVGIDETGQLSKSGTLHIAADTISFDHANTYAGESIKLQAKESIENTDSSLLSNGDTLLTANQMVSNQNGKLMSKESMEIQAGAMTSSGLIGVGIDETGELSKDGTLYITADTISFDHAKTYAGESIKLQAKENIENKASTLLSNGDALLTGNRMISNENGKLLSKKSMEIQAGAVESTGLIGVGVNEDGILSEAGNLQITADTIAFNRAKTYAGKNVTLQANSSIANDNSTLLANNAMTVTSQGSVTNRQNSQISSGKSLVIQATQGIENNQSRLSSAEKMSLHTNGSFTNTNGRIEAVDDIELKANQDIENINSTILANGTIQLTANQHFNNSQNAQITSGKSLAIEGKNGVVNSQSGLTSCGDLAIETNETFTNVKGKIEAVDELQLQAGKNIENTNSTLLANGKMDLNSKGSLKNTQNSRIASGNTLSIQAQDGIENSQSSLASAGNITVDTMGILSNTKGNIEAQKELIVTVNAVENDAESKIIGVNGQLAIHAQQKIENHGMIGSNQAVNLTGTEIINQAGTITSQDALHIEAQNSVDNTNGSIQTKKSRRFKRKRY